jgi:hypothetical protein
MHTQYLVFIIQHQPGDLHGEQKTYVEHDRHQNYAYRYALKDDTKITHV